jgi:threonine 3-dehydrogenase
MYGLNKLYLEQFGTYFNRTPDAIDFRCVRLPGVVSGVTLPSGGTSDYFPEMIHAAARGTPYRCFVTPESRIPFMMMPDAVKALIDLSRAPRESLRRCVYNVSALSLTAAEIRDRILSYFPDAEISFQPQPKRLAIVQSWPRDVDDSAACAEWGWSPRFGLDAAFDEYLIPHIRSLVTNQPSTSLSVAS